MLELAHGMQLTNFVGFALKLAGHAGERRLEEQLAALLEARMDMDAAWAAAQAQAVEPQIDAGHALPPTPQQPRSPSPSAPSSPEPAPAAVSSPHSKRVSAPRPRETFSMVDRSAAQAPPKRKAGASGNPFARKKNKA